MGNIEENADEYKRKHGELPHNQHMLIQMIILTAIHIHIPKNIHILQLKK